MRALCFMIYRSGLPHSGQNFGIPCPAEGLHPQFVQPELTTGLGVPQFAQNFPLLCAPQDGHTHVSLPIALGAEAGLS